MQKTSYDLRISYCSSDVCSSDLQHLLVDCINQFAIVAWRCPALTLHLKAAAFLKRVRCEIHLQLCWIDCRRCGESIYLKILEPHTAPDEKKGLFYTRPLDLPHRFCTRWHRKKLSCMHANAGRK